MMTLRHPATNDGPVNALTKSSVDDRSRKMMRQHNYIARRWVIAETLRRQFLTYDNERKDRVWDMQAWIGA